MKNDDIKNLVAKIENNEITLEELLKNNDFMQPTVKNKFMKFSKFFMKKDWIEKLIYYSLNYDANIKDYETISHNSSEILSLVKNNQFIKELMKSAKPDEEDNQEQKEKEIYYPYLDKYFNYLNKPSFENSHFSQEEKKKTTNTKMEIEIPNEKNQIYCEEMLNGYFERIFYNLIIKKKKKVSYFFYFLLAFCLLILQKA